VASFRQVFPSKPGYAPFLSSVLVTLPPTPFFLILSLDLYLVRSIDHKAPRYVVFSTSLLPRLLGPNIFLITLFLNKRSLCSSLNVSDQVSHS
jgi:hypothetical protein